MQSIRLADGTEVPSVGLGFWKVENEKAADLTVEAISRGYRHLDNACDYGNEAEVGEGIERAIQDGLCEREDLWVTSKLWNTYHSADHVRLAVERSLSDLRVDYLDLYLVHFPIPLQFVPFETRYPPGWFFDPEADEPRMELANVPVSETWRAMEQLVDEGLVKHIGVSNFSVVLMRDLMTYARIRPSMLQVELHPYLTQEKLVRFCQQQEIAVTGFSPLGAMSYFSIGMAEEGESVLDQPVVKAAAARHGKTPAQVVLRWGVQRGTAIIPKTSKPDRLSENIDLFDFELSRGEMNSIAALNQNRRFNDPGVFGEEAFNTFVPIYE